MERETIAALVVVGIPAWIASSRAILGALGDVGHLPSWLSKYDRARAVRMVLAVDREQAITAVVEHAEAITRLAQVADVILAEVTPNHGSSLKDSVTRTEQLVAEHIAYARAADVQTGQRLESIEGRLREGDERMARIEARQ